MEVLASNVLTVVNINQIASFAIVIVGRRRCTPSDITYLKFSNVIVGRSRRTLGDSQTIIFVIVIVGRRRCTLGDS